MNSPLHLKIAVLLFCAIPCVLTAQNNPVTINIDAAEDHRVIHPEIYGVNFGDTNQLNSLNSPLNRMGGNRTSGYNWLENADTTGSDWYFQSYPGESAIAGEIGDTFISNTKAGNAEPMITVPMLDWVAKLKPGRGVNWSFSIAKYGQQTDSDFWYPDSGNGILLNGNDVVNDPSDAGAPNSAVFQQAWVQHMIDTWGTSTNNGVRYYVLDNEHSIWHETHRDFHPVGATYDQIRQKIIDYATMIHDRDPNALVAGPEEFGWSGYFFSGYDLQFCNDSGDPGCWSNPPDRADHGGALYLDWLLDELHDHEVSSGDRILDIFSLHYYPQSGEFSNNTSNAMQLLRNRSTRSLWDPNYLDESWIQDQVRLIPRMREWVDTYYPGLRIGITEYSWGADDHINGATTQADILGIFGREGLDLATRWVVPALNTPVAKAFQMYRNYDGQNSTFGDVSVRAVAPDPDTVSAFSALRNSDDALTVMVISKHLTGSTPVTVNVSNFQNAGIAQVWRLTSTNVIQRLADIQFAGASFVTNVPAQSITLFVVQDEAGPVTSFLLDEFEDSVQSWPVKKGSWIESNGVLRGTGNSTAIAYAPQPWTPSGFSTCTVCTLETTISTTGGSLSKIFIQPWYLDKSNRIDVLIKQGTGKVILKQKAFGTVAAKAKADFAMTAGTFYKIQIGFDGTNFLLRIDDQLLITLPAAATPSGNLYLKVKSTTATFQAVHIN